MNPRTPIVVGAGLAQQRLDEPRDGMDAFGLMERALVAAAEDAGAPAILGGIDLIAVQKGQWRYTDPGRHLAAAVGSPAARSVLAHVGVLQQTLLRSACQAVADGRASVAVVVGGEARHRRARQKRLGLKADDRRADGEPDEVLEAEDELVLEAEVESGLGPLPVGYYAIIESALRAASGQSVDEHRDAIAALYHRMSRVTITNPFAWRSGVVAPEEIRGPTPNNPMLAFPYTKLHNSSWNVDQAAALIICSVQAVERMGIHRPRWVFPRSSTESNHMTAMSKRRDITSTDAARMVGQRALELAGVTVEELSLVDVYSCFPAAVRVHSWALGLPDNFEMTVTGGMPFAGGPFNSYVLQATATMVRALRSGGTGVITSVSGVLTKHAFAVYSSEPGADGFRFEDCTEAVAGAVDTLELATTFEGRGRVVGYTVMTRSGPAVAIVLLDTADGRRTLVSTLAADVVDAIQVDDIVGCDVEVAGGRFELMETPRSEHS